MDENREVIRKVKVLFDLIRTMRELKVFNTWDSGLVLYKMRDYVKRVKGI